MEQAYERYWERREIGFESRCRRCGCCCGVADDPCEQLEPMPDGTYMCRVYENRRGQQRTRSGRLFQCVEIRDLRHSGWLRAWQCAYSDGWQYVKGGG